MSSLRIELEQCLGLKFPARNGEPLIKFEESMEVPRSAETLMRGIYRNPDKITRGFQDLHHETAGLLELIIPRRARLREWAEELPKHPKDAEQFLRNTKKEIEKKEEKLSKIEEELIHELQASGLDDVFPVPLSAFGNCSSQEASAKIYLRPLGRLAELLQLNPEHLRMAVRIYFLILMLLWTGLDLDQQVYKRDMDDPMVYPIVGAYTTRFLKEKSPDLLICYEKWSRVLNIDMPPQPLLEDQKAEVLRASVVFWRRSPHLSWSFCWQTVESLGKGEIQSKTPVFSQFKLDDL